MHKTYTPELCYPVWADDVTAITVINIYTLKLYMATCYICGTIQYNCNDDKVPI